MKPGSLYRYYVLFMLLLVYLLSLIDRQILSVLIEPLRKDLELSDTQIGLLSGLAFGLLYATMAVPLSRLGDRWSRRSLIAICLGAWSLATGLCGATQNFVQLFAVRVAVGTGEAGAGPSSQSLIADYFPPERRATAMGIYSMGIFVGAGLGLALGGWLASIYGWRGAFVAVAVPGVFVALVFRLTVREPVRGQLDGDIATAQMRPTFAQSFGIFFANKPLVAAGFGLGFSVFSVQSLLNWLPAMLGRYHMLAPAAAGARIGSIVAVAGTIGVVAGGLLADKLGRNDRTGGPRMMAIASLLVPAISIPTLLSGELTVIFIGLAITFFLSALVSGPTFGLIQNLAPPSLRAFSAAMVGLIAVLLGNVLGPLVTGVVSDLYATNGAAQPLRSSIATSMAISGLGAIAYWWVARRI